MTSDYLEAARTLEQQEGKPPQSLLQSILFEEKVTEKYVADKLEQFND